MKNNGSGMGQRIMQFRANLIGARLETRALPVGGIEVICRLPLDSEVEKSAIEPATEFSGAFRQAPTPPPSGSFAPNGKPKQNCAVRRELTWERVV